MLVAQLDSNKADYDDSTFDTVLIRSSEFLGLYT